MYVDLAASLLWFDVGIKRYTTIPLLEKKVICCGLMQESKDIQPEETTSEKADVVV